MRYAIKNQNNPNVPKIKGNILRINDETFAVRMEPLKPWTVAGDPKLKHLSKLTSNIYDSLDDLSKSNRIWLKNNYPGVLKILVDMDAAGDAFDLHEGNIMLRGNVPVLVDPVYDPGSME